MTPQEAVTAFVEFEKSVGPNANVFVALNLNRWNEKRAFSASIDPDGVLARNGFTVYADDLDALLAEATAKWAEFSVEHRARRIREMALEIIHITAEHGVCTDAALRAGKFSDAEVTDLGPDACVDATEIASNGPFSITPLAKANAA